MQMKHIYWGDYTTVELKEFVSQDPVILLPVGAYEQHGPHLAVNTDMVIAQRLCEGLVENSTVPCAMLPPVWCGISEHHMKFCGSLTLKHETMAAFIFDLLDGLGRSGIRKVLAVNSHGGNMVAINEALTKAAQKFGGTFALLTYWSLLGSVISQNRKSEFGGISHAGEMETALQLFLNEQNVRKDKLPPENNVHGGRFWSPAMFASNKISLYIPYDQLSEYGHIGDPKSATADFGEKVYQAVVTQGAELIEAIQKGELLNENF